MRLRYYQETKSRNPQGFQRLLDNALNYFDVTPLTSFEYLSAVKLATTPLYKKTTKSPPQERGRRESLSFVLPDNAKFSDEDDESFAQDSIKTSKTTTSKKPTIKSDKKHLGVEETMSMSGNSVTVTPFKREERHQRGLMEVGYIGIKYRPNSLVDVFQKKIKHSVARDGMSFEIEVPKHDGELTQNINAATNPDAEQETVNDVMTLMNDRVGPAYVKALLMQITTATDEEDETTKILIKFDRKVIPESMVLHKFPVEITAETGKYDAANNPKTYTYKIVDFVYVFKVANSERFIKRYANYNEDNLADAFDDLAVGDSDGEMN